MRRTVLLIALLAGAWTAPLAAREAVPAAAPSALAVTMYRDPARGIGDEMDRRWPRGFAMITETRTVTLPPGESTVRFEGVAEGMVAVSAIVTGLPGGTIEKNRNADLLSPAALVDGTLGNRVIVTRTNPATGVAVSESAVVRTRADGGLVLQTSEGFEAVRCAGMPEKLTFDRVPAGLSPQPAFSIDTRDAAGGTYTVELTYLAWGFDWQAHYVATLDERGRGGAVGLKLMSWLTLLNDNGQSFPDAELLVVAGRLNVVSDFEALADPPRARGLYLTCYPLGSTARGSAEVADMAFRGLRPPPPPPPAPIMAMAREAQDIVVTGSSIANKAQEEALGDLKLYRVPERVTIAAQSLKQVAFLDQNDVEGRLLYSTSCSPWDEQDEPQPTSILLATVNDKRHGLGMALPMGGVTVFEPSAYGDQLVAEDRVRDYAEGQDVELGLGESRQVFAQCERADVKGEDDGENANWRPMRTTVSNANPQPVMLRVALGSPVDLQFRGLKRTRVKDGVTIAEVTIPGNSRRVVAWDVRRASDTASD